MTDGKPFEPTPSRLARARREGDLPRSLELPGGAALTGACLCVAVVTPHLGSAVVHALKSAVSGEPTPGPYITVAVCVMAVCFAAAACGVVACLVANGGIAVKALGVDFTKINPVAGLRRMFSVGAIGFGGRAMLAATIAGLALAPAVYRAFSQNAAAEPVVSAETVVRALQSVLVTACALGVAFGVLDALLERLLWRRRLRMSLFEMKEDLKQSEGDPHLRHRRRTQHRALIRGSLSRLPEAAFVVTNPSHVAIALQYRPPAVPVPRVLIRAVDAGARFVKARAVALKIPVIEDVALARTLLVTSRIDEVIPRMCYLAVARIVAALLHGARRQ